MQTSFAPEPRGCIEEELRSQVRDRLFREMRKGDVMTEQFPDTGTLKRSFNAPLAGDAYTDPTILAMFHRFRQTDKATFAWAIEKRIRLATPAQNQLSFRHSSELAGPTLWDGLYRGLALKEPVPLNQDLLDFCHLENQRNRIFRKNMAMLLSSAGRDDPDLDIRQIQIILKQEYKRKEESIFADAKAGQTLAVFHTAVLFHMGAVGRYLTYQIERILPDRLYIHLRRSPAQLSKWLVQRGWKDNVDCTDNDYTAFDQSQDAAALYMELQLMVHFGIPQHYIDFYYWLKTETRSWLGPFAIMRFTGEWSTFLFNTLFSIAYSFSKYDFPADALLCFGGDDSSFNCRPVVRPGWKYLESLFTLVSKENVSQRPTFVSWRLTSRGIFKSPRLMAARLIHSEANLTLMETVSSYFLEHSFAYLLSDQLYEYLDEDDCRAHEFNTHFFHQHRRHIPGYYLVHKSSRYRALYLRLTENLPHWRTKNITFGFLTEEEQLEALLLQSIGSYSTSPIPGGELYDRYDAPNPDSQDHGDPSSY